MIFQMTGKTISEEDKCEKQGDSDWQIAMYYFRLIAGKSSKPKLTQAKVHDLLKQYSVGDISFGRLVELLNE